MQFKNALESVKCIWDCLKMVCRVCLNKSEFEISIFDDNSSDQHIANAIQKHFWFTPLRNDAISTLICLECWKVIREFNEFYETVERAHKLFFEQSDFPDESARPATGIECTEPIPEYKNVEAIISICENYEYQNSNIEANAVRHVNSKDGIPSEADEVDCKPDLNLLKKYKLSAKKSIEKPCNPTVAKNSTKLNAKKTVKIKQDKHCWSNAESEEIMRKHLNLNCDICSFPTLNFGELEKHFQAAHPDTKAYIKCCNRRFNNKQRVAQHAYMHEDPNSFQCNICQKTFASAYSLRSHKIAYHPTENELIFQCDQCEKRFPRQYLLDYHKAIHVPVEERKYLCTQCQKTFASDHLLKAHISMNHTRATNVCHICAKTIRDKQAFEKHVRLHFEESGPRVKCPHEGCDKYLKDEENLKVHLRRHRQETQNFSCDQCGKILKTRMALTSHKNYTHTPDKFSCNLCAKRFKREISLKEHMASHLGEPLYKCPFCARTFNSNANMHSHKKKQHPIEWENWRKTKTKSAQSTIS